MNKEESYINSVGIINERIFTKWGNGKFGTITVNQLCMIEFQELDESSYNPYGEFTYKPIGKVIQLSHVY